MKFLISSPSNLDLLDYNATAESLSDILNIFSAPSYDLESLRSNSDSVIAYDLFLFIKTT